MRLPRMKEGDLLVIKLWDLTEQKNGWLSDEQAQNYPCMLVALCGWFVNKDKDFMRISNMICGDGDKTITIIPRGFLKSVKVVPYDRG